MGSGQLLSIHEVAHRLDINDEAAFDLVFVIRELPLYFRGSDHGVLPEAAEDYREAHPIPET